MRFKFTLRDKVWFALVVAIVFVWLLDHWRSSHNERRLSQELTKLKIDMDEVMAEDALLRTVLSTDPHPSRTFDGTKETYGKPADGKPANRNR